jgi:hypothetical protein
MRTSVTDAIAHFELRGGKSLLIVTALGIALDGGDLRMIPSEIELHGNTLRWERENTGGGRIVTTVHPKQARITGVEMERKHQAATDS